MFRAVLALALLLVGTVAFYAPAATRPARMVMLFGGKKTSTPTSNVGKTSSISQGAYVPEGLTREQYEKVLAEQAKSAEAKKKKFFKGKQTESLTEWMLKEAKKGLSGKDLNIKGHRMVKAKYDEFYTDDQSGVTW